MQELLSGAQAGIGEEILGSLTQAHADLLQASQGLPTLHAGPLHSYFAKEKQGGRKMLATLAFPNSAPTRLPCLSGAQSYHFPSLSEVSVLFSWPLSAGHGETARLFSLLHGIGKPAFA